MIRGTRFADDTALVEAGVEAVRDALREAIGARGHANLLIAAGRVLTATCEGLRHTSGIPWEDVHVWFADERWTEDAADRNDISLGAALFDHVDAHLHPMPGPDGVTEPADAAESYAAGMPEGFDVSLLSIGEDGHVASLFPHAPGLDETGLVIVVENSPKPPPTRLSVTMPVLLAVPVTIMMVSGSSKADALAKIEAGGTAPDFPSGMLTGAVWLVDADAAGG